MKLSPRMKKLLMVLSVICIAAVLTGCSVPTDENGNIILIEQTTSFRSLMADESWFSAIFVWPLAQLINYLTPTFGVGIAIAVITISVNGLLAIGTFKTTIGMQEMQLIQPELERIKRKYEGRDDAASRNKMAQEQANLYSKHHINPFSTMIVSFIQLPIIMAMYMAVQRSAAVQNGTFLGLNLKLSPVQGLQNGEYLYIILFLFMAICQFLSMWTPQHFSKVRARRIAEKQHRKPEEAGKSNMIMQVYMMVMILAFGLMWPTAMTVYWSINSLVNVTKTVIVQKYIDISEAKKGGSRK